MGGCKKETTHLRRQNSITEGRSPLAISLTSPAICLQQALPATQLHSALWPWAERKCIKHSACRVAGVWISSRWLKLESRRWPLYCKHDTFQAHETLVLFSFCVIFVIQKPHMCWRFFFSVLTRLPLWNSIKTHTLEWTSQPRARPIHKSAVIMLGARCRGESEPKVAVAWLGNGKLIAAFGRGEQSGGTLGD